MKFVPIAFFLTLLLAGCNPSKDIEESIKATPPAPPASATAGGTATAPTTSDKSDKTNTTDKTPSPNTAPAAPTKEATAPPVDKSADNPNRAFQLRSLDKTTLKVNGKPIDAWVMDTELKRSEGMMFLTDKDVRDNQGMIFVFQGPQTDKNHGFWMKNTILPLDIVYLGADHKVLNVQAGKPMDEKNLPPAGAFTDVIELKQGQAAKLGIKPGTPVEIPKDLKAIN